MSSVCYILLGLWVLLGIDKTSARNTSSGAEVKTRVGESREHNGRRLVGEDTSPGEFPFFAQWGGCGATLIWEDILLTSANCNAVESESVLVGAYDSNEEQGDSVKRNITSRHIHPTFDPNSLMDNFMVLKLNKKVDTLPTVWINPLVEIPKDPELYVVGFGFTATLVRVNHIHSRTFYHTVVNRSESLQFGNETDSRSQTQGKVLQKARTTIVPHAVCNAHDQYAGFIDDKSMICASDDDNTCLGDNGGPLCVMMNNECLQIGIVSFGELCSMGIRPTVYSSVSSAFGWIEKMVCALSENPPSTSCQAHVEKPYPGSSESFVSRAEMKEKKKYVPSDEPSITPSDGPSIRNSIIPSDGPSLAPSGKRSSVSSVTPSAKSSDHLPLSENKNITSEQENRDLEEIRFKMPRDVFMEASDTIRMKQPDGTHLFFWPFGSPYGKLGPCEGDCNNDDDCAEGLYCFQRDSSIESVPGCVGHDTSRTDFCTYKTQTNSNSELTIPGRTDSATTDEIVTLPALSMTKLGQCEGDCNSDEDCAEGLYCFIRNGDMTSVPGCEGFDDSRTDFCTRVSSFEGHNDKRVPTNNVAPPPMLFVFPENPPNPWDLPLKACQGDCDADSDCADGLICYARPRGSTSIPGCSGISKSRTDFCVNPFAIPSLASAPSRQETAAPTESATSETTFQPTATTKLSIVTEDSATEEVSTPSPTSTPTSIPITSDPSGSPTPIPSSTPTSLEPSPAPTPKPTRFPTTIPTSIPTTGTPSISRPSILPTKTPTRVPTAFPTSILTSRNPSIPTIFNPIPSPIPLTTQPPTATRISGKSNINPSVSLTQAPSTKPNILNPSPSPTPNPTPNPSSSASSVLITLAIFFDPWPEEVSWKIESEDGNLIASVLPGHYQTPKDQTFEFVRITPGEKYRFTIADSGKDGIAGIGVLYEIFLTENKDMVLLDGDGVFESRRNQTFYVPTTEEYPTGAPVAPTVSPAPTFHTVNVYLTILFDNWHQETSWQIADAKDPNIVYAEAPYDTYRAGESRTNEIPLPPGKEYVFTIKDFFDDGIKDGEYLLMTADGTMLFEGDGDFGESRNHTFTLRGGS